MSLTAKKINYIFRPLNSNVTVDKCFSCDVNSWRKESQPEENNNLFEQQTEVGSTIPLDLQNTLTS